MWEFFVILKIIISFSYSVVFFFPHETGYFWKNIPFSKHFSPQRVTIPPSPPPHKNKIKITAWFWHFAKTIFWKRNILLPISLFLKKIQWKKKKNLLKKSPKHAKITFNMKRWFKDFLLSYFEYFQIWLNMLYWWSQLEHHKTRKNYLWVNTKFFSEKNLVKLYKNTFYR